VQDSLFGTLGKRVVAWAVLVFAALLALKLASVIVFGLLQALFMIFLVVLAVVGVMWAVRHI
jgi:hypothetical protein